ncbi:hypothetical protein CONCODRAFT_9684 [Conidiobolus coronatus NRRL 28638]|uniref:FAD/NAD(P)-binding domain-containing protein n=1 Tax=Conidiobolus coronatus (strain ATCC 28846 / CBS 209.66 / NRRL 28638) TaxID=796925 RepID=A0A137NZV1_CONC2|nr:hypothetical protein CONCODRAFT_9684 [Conidiobolus coronatus NRRL 28638]|eukprot:KXN68144.1 hypothetical protein CONCODRAFT_9684 [Conidiobolus coronatus NRRL 28638]
MYFLNNVRQALILLLISQNFFRAELLKDPVCIIGAGISGLIAAHRLKEKGYSVKVFEKNSNKIKFDSTHFLDVSGYQLDTGLKILLPQQLYDKSTKVTWAHYRKIHKSLTIETSLVEANPELFVSISEWLKANKLESLKMYALLLLTSEGYGHIDDIPAFDNGAKVAYLTKSGSKTQKCSSVIIVFTPLHNHVSSIILDLSAEEKEILERLDGGRQYLISNKSRGGAVSYHWTKGNFNVGPTNEELSLYQSENDKIIPKLFPSNDTKTNIYAKGWNYFPHVTTESLQDGFYNKFYSIQGKSNVYYATPLLGFELIEYSIRAGECVANYFY